MRARAPGYLQRVAIDGTGAPTVPRETQDRPGKDGVGPAKTREAKLGCVFTQTGFDEKGRPVRDEGSTTYVVGAIESAEEFGRRIFAEAIRRGSLRAEQIIILGDGALWIWNLADEHFPGAIQIVDLYHAREHLGELAKILYGPGIPKARAWTALRIVELDAGDVERLISTMTRLRLATATQRDALRRSIPYLQINDPECGTTPFAARAASWDQESSKPAARPSPGAASRVLHALDRPQRQRHHRPALLRSQRSLGVLLGSPLGLDPPTIMSPTRRAV
jgi:hypothetical protein